MNDVYRRYFATDPPARATAVVGLMGSDATVEISLIASALPKEMIGPEVSPTLPVSTAVRAGRRLFLSGVLGGSETTTEDATAQARDVMNHISHTLDLAGVTFGNVVDTTLYVPDLLMLPKIDDVYAGFFAKDPPARTVAGAKLIGRTGLLEVMVTAIK
jgi:2-iminobutanoate/2-iminopropanoate deaminase